MRVLSTLAIRAGLLVVTLPKCAKWLIGDSFLFRSEMCESRSLAGEGAERTLVREAGEGSQIFARFAHTPHPARLRFAPPRHPLPQGERGSACAARLAKPSRLPPWMP